MGSLSGAVERLAYEWRALERQQEAAADQWRDAVHQQFAREYWAEYERAVPETIEQIAHLQQVVAQAQAEVP